MTVLAAGTARSNDTDPGFDSPDGTSTESAHVFGAQWERDRATFVSRYEALHGEITELGIELIDDCPDYNPRG